MEQQLVNIGETIVHGVAFDPKNSERVAHMDLNKLFVTVERLFDLLEERQVDYVLAGGIAMLAYVEGRNTQDIDLILSRSALRNLPEVAVEDESGEFVRAKLDDLQVDLLLTSNKLFARVASDYTTNQTFANREVRCATPEGLVLLKLFALPSLYRQGKFDKVDIYERDITALLRLGGFDAEHLFEILESLVLPSDFAELRKIVASIVERIASEGSRFDK